MAALWRLQYFTASSVDAILSLTPAAAARLYGHDRLAGLSGLLMLFKAPGNGAGADLSGAVLSASNHKWSVVAVMNGAMQLVGEFFMIFGKAFIHLVITHRSKLILRLLVIC